MVKQKSVSVEVYFPESLPGQVEVELPDSVCAITCQKVNGKGFTALAAPVNGEGGKSSKRTIHFVRRNGAAPHGLRRDCQVTARNIVWDVYLDSISRAVAAAD